MIAPARLKLELATRGARLDAAAALAPSSPIDGMAAVDLVLPRDVWVTVPVDERLAAHSPWHLTVEGGRHVLVRGDDRNGDTTRVVVRPVAPPRFYERRTSRGIPMRRIATLRGTHLVLSLSGACGFSVCGTPCRFCVEGARVHSDSDAVAVADVIEVVRAAFDEGLCGSVYFNTAFSDGEDGGIAFLAPYVEAVRRHFDTLVATQVHPPRSDAWIDRTYAMGVDAVSYNLEIFDAAILGRHCIGRARYIGRERYFEALAHAASVFPRGTVWTDLVLGLEPLASTLEGIDALAGMGVVPVVSIVAGQAGTDPDEVEPVLSHLYRAARQHHVALGWVRDLVLGITPLEARPLTGDAARLAVTVQTLTRSRLGALAARSLARFRRRLRVRGDDRDAGH